MSDRTERNDVLYFLAHVLPSSIERIDDKNVLLLNTEAGQISYELLAEELPQFKDVERRSWIHDGHTPVLQAVRLKGSARAFRNSMDIMTRRLAEYDAEAERRKLEAQHNLNLVDNTGQPPQQLAFKFDYKIGV